MIADEADQDGSKEFLIFAAVFFPSNQLQKINDSVSKLRTQYGFNPGDPLKSGSGTRPEGVSADSHAKIKNEVLSLAVDTGCKICCYVTPHAIAKGQSKENQLKFGVNTLLIKFDQFLGEQNGECGIAFFDQTTDFKQAEYLRDLFAKGLPWRDGSRKQLKKIVKIETTAVGHSHLNSVTDIVVGSFRFVANEPEKDKVGTILMKHLASLMWGIRDIKGGLSVGDRGLVVRPKNINFWEYKADISAFKTRLEKYANTK